MYVDSASKEVLHLEPGGRAVRSPGTALGMVDASGCLWWSARDNVLHIVDCLGRPFVWPGTSGNLRRDPYQAGMLAGFVFEGNPTVPPKLKPVLQLEQQVHLIRDPLGFVFPGCLYILSLPSGSRSMATPRQIRVLLHLDGTVADEKHGAQIATWSFVVPQVFPGIPSEPGATGDALELIFKTDDDDQVQLILDINKANGVFALGYMRIWCDLSHGLMSVLEA